MPPTRCVQAVQFLAAASSSSPQPVVAVTMLVLFETPAGYALFKVADKLTAVPTDALGKEFATAEDAHSAVKLSAFHRFADTTEVRRAARAQGEGGAVGVWFFFFSSRARDGGGSAPCAREGGRGGGPAAV